MIITIRRSEQPAEHRRAYWNWCFANGVIATEIADLVVVDSDLGTLTVRQWLPVSQPGDPDFPELRRDEHNEPVVELRTLPLQEPVPDWMVISISEQLAA